MASAPAGEGTVLGRVDRTGRLSAADPALARLQQQAGAVVGDLLALPQLASIARLAATLNVPVERAAIAAAEEGDYDLWVRAVPEDDEVLLLIEGWTLLAAGAPRFGGTSAAAASPQDQPEPDLAWTADADMNMSAIGADLARLLNVGADEALGLPLIRLVQLIESDDGDLPLLLSLPSRRSFACQRARTRKEPIIDLVVNGEPRLGPSGEFVGYSGTIERADGGRIPAPSVDSVANGLGLEMILRKPLEAIIADAERIIDRRDGPLRSDYASYGTDIAAAARHLSRVIEAMGNDPEYGLGRINLGSLAAEAMMLVEPAAQERGVRIELAQTGALPTRGEEHAVIQILVNLIGNAIRHSPAGAAVRLDFGRSEQQVAVSVRDSGRGIALEDQQRIFERFERADEDPGGTGLGLAISRRLARSMGGEVSLQSVPGEGACFTLSLPAD